jgi:superfamily II DNA or RNA helicase
VRQNRIAHHWNPVKEPFKPLPPPKYRLRVWQEQAYAVLKDAQYRQILAPMGSGKSLLMSAISAYQLGQDSRGRVIFSVPQTIIGYGFTKHAEIVLADGTTLDWVRPKYNYCRPASAQTVKGVLSFLCDPHSLLWERSLICTHATLVAAFSKRPDLFRDILIWIDEAHHVMNAQIEDKEDTLSNRIGEIVKLAITQPKQNISVNLVTATFYRGDYLDIIPPLLRRKFTRYSLPIDEYLPTMKALRSFSMDYVFYRGDWEKPVHRLLQDMRRTIVWIPSTQSRESSKDKYREANEILRAIAGDDGTIRECSDGLTLVKTRERHIVKVLNLVDEHHRKQKKVFYQKANDKASNLDVIVAMNMFKEGADWIHAERGVIIGNRHSLTDIVQTIGRLFRDAPKKTHVDVLHVLPAPIEKSTGFRDQVNNFVKGILCCLILENHFAPVKLSVSDGEKRAKKVHRDYFREKFPDLGQQLAVMNDVNNALITQSLYTSHGPFKTYQNVLPVVLKKHNVRVTPELEEQIWRILVRHSRGPKRNLSDVSFDVLKKADPVDGLLHYTSGVCNIGTFKQLRQALGEWMSFEQARQFARSLKLRRSSDWGMYCRLGNRPRNIPTDPRQVYKHEWVSMRDWLGTNWLPFEEARRFVRSLKLRRWSEWVTYSRSGKKPKNVPADPSRVYRDEWVSMPDWLGYGRGEWLPFVEARRFVRSLKLESIAEWYAYCKSGMKPQRIPTAPWRHYEDWIHTPDWLGTATPWDKPDWLPFARARRFVRSLQLRHFGEWRDYCKSGNKPKNIPNSPAEVYHNKGWVNWYDWLGKE